MKVAVKKVIEIEGVGIYREVSNWEEFTKWENIKDSMQIIITVDTNKNSLTSLFLGAFDDDDKKITIVMADCITSSSLQAVKDETKVDEKVICFKFIPINGSDNQFTIEDEQSQTVGSFIGKDINRDKEFTIRLKGSQLC